MATITPRATPIAGGYIITWSPLAAGDTLTPWPIPGSAEPGLDPPDAQTLTDRCVQAYGGTIGTVHIEGSNMMPTAVTAAFATLHEVDGSTAVSLTSSVLIRQVLEPTYFVRPAPTGGATGTTVAMKAVTGARHY